MTDQPKASQGGLPQSVIAALIIAAIVIAYFTIGTVFNSGKADEDPAVVERPLFTVLVLESTTADSNVAIRLNGRTEASTQIIVRAETPGQVASTIADGAQVKKGDLLCELQTDSRRAVLAEASAAVAKVEADYEAARRLNNEGFTADAGLRTARAALDAARARQTQARLDLNNTKIKAPFDGTVAEVMAEPGDVLGVGGACASLADLANVIVAGGVSARDAQLINTGDRAIAIVDGEEVSGVVRYVADVADDRTRSFRVEISLSSGGNRASSGLAADAEIFTGQAQAVRIPRNALVFNDEGSLGIRVVKNVSDSGVGEVEFRPVTIVTEDDNGVAISGVPAKSLIIVRGQEFVGEGHNVAIESAIAPVNG